MRHYTPSGILKSGINEPAESNTVRKTERTQKSEVILQETPEHAPSGWREVQESVAESSGISLLLIDGHQPPALTVTNNNSICNALQSSPSQVKLCDPYCGEAHARAIEAGSITHYRCHAGLQCFAMPIEIDKTRELAVIGGRAFVRSSDYRDLVERFRSGDLRQLASEEVFQNVIFADESALDHAALRLTKAASEFVVKQQPQQPAVSETNVQESAVPAAVDREPRATQLHTSTESDRAAGLADSIRRFAEQIDASDPIQTYKSIVARSADLLHAERSSLLLFDESTNQLTVTAARGIPARLSEVAPVAVGEGIAGAVLRENRPLVATIDELGRASLAERRYKTNSFISYPITIGERRFGVLNLADKTGGGAYDLHDLTIIDLVAPQIALALERAAWQQRANQFQLMSITDPLTGLHNRRYLEARLAEELSRSKRYNYPLSFMMIDIDDFKLYNDLNGHQAGDRALEMTAQSLRAALRKVDVASRYGGEEFSILLPQTSLEEAGVIADRIRRKIMATSFPHGKTQPLGRVTVSIGLSTFSPTLDSAEGIVRAADRALYHAKSHGKNRAYAYQGAQQVARPDSANAQL
ncbi:MAG TPA: diguanylate cyclase [Pyrinomonadaceae bacterium]|nr:diguanylate cyclase [Pyrinomonadaceae bacterium]